MLQIIVKRHTKHLACFCFIENAFSYKLIYSIHLCFSTTFFEPLFAFYLQ